MNPNEIIDNLKPQERVELTITGSLIKYQGFISEKCEDIVLLRDNKGCTISIQRKFIEDVEIL